VPLARPWDRASRWKDSKTKECLTYFPSFYNYSNHTKATSLPTSLPRIFVRIHPYLTFGARHKALNVISPRPTRANPKTCILNPRKNLCEQNDKTLCFVKPRSLFAKFFRLTVVFTDVLQQAERSRMLHTLLRRSIILQTNTVLGTSEHHRESCVLNR
jgi:hypothetical protein